MNPNTHPVYTSANPAPTNVTTDTFKPRGANRDSGFVDISHDNAHSRVPGGYPDTDDSVVRSANPNTTEEPSGLKKIINKLNPLHHSPSNSSLSSSDGEAVAASKATNTTAVPGTTSRTHGTAAGLGAGTAGAATVGTAAAAHQHTQPSKPKQVAENIKQKVRRSGSASSLSSSDEEKIARNRATGVHPTGTQPTSRSAAIPGAAGAAGMGVAGLGAGTAAARHHDHQYDQTGQYGMQHEAPSKPKQVVENIKQKIHQPSSASSSDFDATNQRGAVPTSDRHHAMPAAAGGLAGAGLGAGAAGAMHQHRTRTDQTGHSVPAQQYGQTGQSKPKQMMENVKQKLHRSGSASSLSSSDEEKAARRGVAPGATTTDRRHIPAAAGVGAAGLGAGTVGTAAAMHHQQGAQHNQIDPYHAQQQSKPKQMMETVKQKLDPRVDSPSSASSSDDEVGRQHHSRAMPGAAGLGAGAVGATAAHKMKRNKLKKNPETTYQGLAEPQHSAADVQRHGNNTVQPNYAAEIANDERSRGHWGADPLQQHADPTTVRGNEHRQTESHLARNAAIGLGAAGTGAATTYGVQHRSAGNTSGIRPGSEESAPLVPSDARTTDAVRGQRIREAPALPERNLGFTGNSQAQPGYTANKLDSNITSGHGITGTHPTGAATGAATGASALQSSHGNTNVQGVQQSLRNTHLGNEPVGQYDQSNSHSFGKKAAVGTGAAAATAAGAAGMHSHRNDNLNTTHNEPLVDASGHAKKPSLTERIKGAITGHGSDKTTSGEPHFGEKPHFAEDHHVAGPTHTEQGAYNASSNQRSDPINYQHPASTMPQKDANFQPGYSYPPEERNRDGQMGRDAKYDGDIASPTQMNRSTGLYADGGDFDAARPGAGHEASRLGHN